MARPTDDSHFPSAMNFQDLLDMTNAIPEECASTLPNSNAHRALPTRAPPNTANTPAWDKTAQINYEDCMLAKLGSLLKTNALSDVILIVGEEKLPIHAHKLILALASPVFTAMFYGDLASGNKPQTAPASIDSSAPGSSHPEKTPATQTTTPAIHHNLPFTENSTADPTQGTLPPPPPPNWQAASVVEIPDCTPQAMKAFLHFIYNNGPGDKHSPSISVDDALSLLYTARKYSVRGLEDKCVVTLSSSITADNVFDILYAANFYNLTSLDQLCWEFMEEYPVDVLNSHLQYLTHDTIQSVLKNDKLNCSEVELFKVLMKWAEQECAKMNLDSSPENIRRLCATELKMIRFPIMTGPEFADTVVPTGVLTVEQIAKIFTAINTSEEKKKLQEQQQDPSMPSRSSILLNGMEFSSKRRCPNEKAKSSNNAQSLEDGGSTANEEMNRPPVFTFMAQQEIRNREADQQQNRFNQNQQQTGNNTAVANNDVVGVVDYAGIVGIVPLAVPPAPLAQAGAGERGRSRQRQSRRTRRRSGSNSSENQNQAQQQ